jgi:hypothetical protein
LKKLKPALGIYRAGHHGQTDVALPARRRLRGARVFEIGNDIEEVARDGGRYGREFYTVVKTVYLDPGESKSSPHGTVGA